MKMLRNRQKAIQVELRILIMKEYFLIDIITIANEKYIVKKVYL